MLAAQNGHANVISLLLQAEADVKLKDKVRQRFFIGTVWDYVFVRMCVCMCVFYSSIILYDK